MTTKKKAKPVGLRQLLKAIKTRKAKPGTTMTQADYAVALDTLVRAIRKSQKTGAVVTVQSVRVL